MCFALYCNVYTQYIVNNYLDYHCWTIYIYQMASGQCIYDKIHTMDINLAPMIDEKKKRATDA